MTSDATFQAPGKVIVNWNAQPGHLIITPPCRRIFNDADLSTFLKSRSHSKICLFIEQLCQAIQNPSNEAPSEICMQIVSDILDPLQAGIALHPPLQTSQRFGNRAFTTWHQWAAATIPDLLFPLLHNPQLHCEASAYLAGSFGDPSRIDYGTGHELSFIVFLMVLNDSGKLLISDSLALVVFQRYWKLVRSIITAYQLEPAGSHGVWGLDDYHHLPFLFGAAELMKSTLPVKQVFSYKTEGFFGDALLAVRQGKCAALHEAAPILWSISEVESWGRVTLGLFRMYQAEVLGKRPVVQHLLFGTCLPWET